MGLVNPATEAAKELMPCTLNRNATTREKGPKNLWITQKPIHRVRRLKRAQEAEDQQKRAGSHKNPKKFWMLAVELKRSIQKQSASGVSSARGRCLG